MVRWLGVNESIDLSIGSDVLAVRSMMLDYAARSSASWGGQPWAAASAADAADGTWLASDSSLWSWIAYSLGGKSEWTTVIIPGVYVSPSMVGLFALEELLISSGPGQTLLPGTQYRAWHDDYPHVGFNPPPSTIYVGPNSPYNQPNLLAPGTPSEGTPTKAIPPAPSTGSRALIAIFAIGVLSLVVFAPDLLAGTRKRQPNPLEKTPGFNRRLQISFSADKNGRPVAYYLGGGFPGRWIRMNLNDAREFVAQDLADQVPHEKSPAGILTSGFDDYPARKENPNRPPKGWFRDCVRGVGASGSAYDPAAVCGAQWQRMSSSSRRAAARRAER